MKSKILFILSICLAFLQANANVTLPRLISNGIVLQRGSAIPVWGWAASGENVTLTFNNNTYTAVTNAAGKWEVSIPAMTAGGPYTMTIAGNNTVTVSDILIGDVFFCSGQSNMAHYMSTSASLYAAEIASSTNTQIRHYKVKKTYSQTVQDDVPSDNGWQQTTPTTVLGFSAVAYFFARDLYAKYGVPIGLINSSYEGTPAEAWMSPQGLAGYPQYLNQSLYSTPEYTPSVLYNAMVAPFLKQPFKGMIWCQGESNRSRAYLYRSLFQSLIQDWRTKFGQGNVPFLFVQLANYLTVVTSAQESNVAECREAQTMALAQPNTAMVVIHETNTDTTTHPLNKKTPGRRLSLAAQNLIYGETAVVYKSPTYQSMTIQGNKIIVSFNNIGGGLVAYNGAIQRFTIAGANRKFVNATATLVGNTIEVSSPQIAKPVAVRYAWFDNPMGANLYNTDSIPVNSFRTDNWSATTYIAPTGSSVLSAPFTKGNVLVYRYSTGTAATALGTATVPAYLDEYATTLAAGPVQTLAIPTVTSGANLRLVGLPKSGTPATIVTEGIPTLSQDGKYLALFGYDQAVNQYTTGTVNRVIARIDSAGTINSTTTIESSIGNPRAVVADGNNFWCFGYANGLRYTTLGSTVASTQVAATPGAARSLGIYKDKLYCFGGDTKLYTFSSLPTSVATPASVTIPAAAGNNQCAFIDGDGDGTPELMYMADDGTIATPQNAAIRKYGFVNGAWTAMGSIAVSDAAILYNLKSLTAGIEYNSVVIYSTTWGNATAGNYFPSLLLRVRDSNAATSTLAASVAMPEVMAVADTNSLFKGVTFTPGSDVNGIFHAPPTQSVTNIANALNGWLAIASFENGALHAIAFVEKEAAATIRITGMNGSLVHQQDVRLHAGENTITLHGVQLSPGIYIGSLQAGHNIMTTKFVR